MMPGLAPHSGSSDRAGFTLVEMLVALAVLGLAMCGAAGLSQLLRRIDTRAATATEIVDQVSAAKRVFRSVVAQAAADGDATDEVEPFGQSSHLTVSSRGPVSLALGAPERLELRVTSTNRRSRLELAWTDPRTGVREVQTVFEGDGISFRYFGQDDTGRQAWQGQWESRTRLPRAVMLRLSVEAWGPPFEIIVRTPSVPHRLEPAAFRKSVADARPRE